MLYSLDQQGRSTWASGVRIVLHKYGFHEVWNDQSVGNKYLFLKEFTDRVKQGYVESWEYETSQSNKLTLLRGLTTSCTETESYLYSVTLRRYRSGLARLRCSSHNLRVEKGRHVNELMADRVCRLCQVKNNYVLDDEYHFMLCCPLLSDIRKMYLPDWSVIECSYQKLITLLSSEDVDIPKNVASYIVQAKRLREQLLLL